ncbi:hypothetical protein OFN51_32515, partial [Escherichia coli]|nr:hypothetical protein [Escherichia coli]
RFAYLVTPQTVFWNRSGIEIDASLSGVSVKAHPLKSLIEGGIAFDSVPGVENKVGERWKLYADQQKARKFGRVISLETDGTQEVLKGMQI